MRKWLMWFVFAGFWILIAILNAYDKRSANLIGYNVFAAILFSLLGIAQYYCDKRGKAGQKAMKWISIAAIVIVLLTLVIIVLSAAR